MKSDFEEQRYYCILLPSKESVSTASLRQTGADLSTSSKLTLSVDWNIECTKLISPNMYAVSNTRKRALRHAKGFAYPLYIAQATVNPPWVAILAPYLRVIRDFQTQISNPNLPAVQFCRPAQDEIFESLRKSRQLRCSQATIQLRERSVIETIALSGPWALSSDFHDLITDKTWDYGARIRLISASGEGRPLSVSFDRFGNFDFFLSNEQRIVEALATIKELLESVTYGTTIDFPGHRRASDAPDD